MGECSVEMGCPLQDEIKTLRARVADLEGELRRAAEAVRSEERALLAALQRVAELEGAIRDTIIDGCEYGDNCPRGANHYVCRPCQLNRALAGAPQGGGEDG